MQFSIREKLYTFIPQGGLWKIGIGIIFASVLIIGFFYFLLASPECYSKARDERIKCFKQDAAMRKYAFQSIFICKRISDITERDGCLASAGLTKAQSSICTKVTNLAKRDDCFFDIAKALSEDNICSKISLIEKRDVCYVDVVQSANKKDTCDLVTDSLKRKDCYCSDGDNGIYIFQRGVVTDRKNSRNEDTCFSKEGVSYLKEWYCDDGGYAQFEELACNTVCTDGACGGPNLSGGVSQAYLPKKSVVECVDSDGGENIYKKGITSGVDRCIYNGVTQDCARAPVERTDSCTEDYNEITGKQNTQVREWFCGPDGRLTISTRSCEKGCIDGACRQ